jgi:hypothetical protein
LKRKLKKKRVTWKINKESDPHNKTQSIYLDFLFSLESYLDCFECVCKIETNYKQNTRIKRKYSSIIKKILKSDFFYLT